MVFTLADGNYDVSSAGVYELTQWIVVGRVVGGSIHLNQSLGPSFRHFMTD
jgi:hypothetical protein